MSHQEYCVELVTETAKPSQYVPLYVAHGDVVRAELVHALLPQEEHEGDLVAVSGGVAEVELGLEGAGHRRGVDPVGQVRRVSAHRGREGGLADVDRILAQGALRKEGTLSCGPQCVTLLCFGPLVSKKAR